MRAIHFKNEVGPGQRTHSASAPVESENCRNYEEESELDLDQLGLGDSDWGTVFLG